MHTEPQASRWLFAAAMVALGITGLVSRDFALAWQQVPPHLPGRTIVACACAVIELATGIGLLPARTRVPACRILLPYLLLWLVLLQVPVVIHAPRDAGAWGSLGEIAIIAAGGWCLFATHAGPGRNPGIVAGPSGIRGARWLLVVALPMIGVEVIVDAMQFGNHVMQPWLQWLPWPAGWAVLTGIGSIAACLALLFGVWPRLAATVEAAMLALIAVSYWGPDLQTGRTATTAFIISFLIAASVWLVADSYRDTAWFATRQPAWKLGTDKRHRG